MSRSRRRSKRQREAAALREARGLLARSAHTRRRRPPSGAAPGEFVVPEDAPGPSLSAMCYAPDALEERSVEDAAALCALVQRSERITWIDIVGFGDRRALEQIAEALGIHQLAMADIVNIPQRPKAELYDDRLLVVTQMARMTDASELDIEQVTFVLGPNWVASFQEHAGDVFDPVRARIRSPQARIRHQRADFLMYALIDAVIDGYFPVVEAIASTVDELEEMVISKPNHVSLARIHAMRRRVLNLHRVQWRQRDAIQSLLRDEAMPFSEGVKPYLRDTHDHAFQTLDAIESFREMLVGLIELQLSSASHRLNEVMKTLTIVATIFIPLTFVAGVYGMNFDYMPELRWRWGYAAVWLSFCATAGVLLLWFRRRGWIGNHDDEK